MVPRTNIPISQGGPLLRGVRPARGAIDVEAEARGERDAKREREKIGRDAGERKRGERTQKTGIIRHRKIDRDHFIMDWGNATAASLLFLRPRRKEEFPLPQHYSARERRQMIYSSAQQRKESSLGGSLLPIKAFFAPQVQQLDEQAPPKQAAAAH